MGGNLVFGPPLFARGFSNQSDITCKNFQFSLQLIDTARLVNYNLIEVRDRLLQMGKQDFQFNKSIFGIFHRQKPSMRGARKKRGLWH